MKEMAKYTTLIEISNAFKSGELDDSYVIVIDKDGHSLRLMQFGPAEMEDAQYENCKKLFKWEYGSPLDELFQIAGIPTVEA